MYIYVACAGLRMAAHRDSPDDIHSAAVENEYTVSAYFTSIWASSLSIVYAGATSLLVE